MSIVPKERVSERARSQEHMYDKRFVSRWADIATDKIRKYGQQVANEWAQRFFSSECLREVNKELESRKQKKQ